MHTGSTRLRPGDCLSLPQPCKSKAPEPIISAPAPWAHLLSAKVCWISKVLYLKPLKSLIFESHGKVALEKGPHVLFLLMLIGNVSAQAVDF